MLVCIALNLPTVYRLLVPSALSPFIEATLAVKYVVLLETSKGMEYEHNEETHGLMLFLIAAPLLKTMTL